MESKPPLAATRCGNTEFRWGERTYIMGVLNLSPDSFSGDGLGDDMGAILDRARQMVTDGADILDIGGESTRPGSDALPAEEELRRVIPAIQRLAGEIAVPISIDTYKSEVAALALKAGASIINDIWGLKHDPGLARAAAEAGVPIILMSNQRDSPEPYDIIKEVISSLSESIKLAVKSGVGAENIIIDPGIGFGKSPGQNMEIIRRLAELKALGKPILLGTSRKFGSGRTPDKRLEETAATVAIGIANGADIVRVHDISQMARVVKMSDAVTRRKN
ncbi:MAG: dihydropteroate synthase [Dehalococcoidales bacterium]